MVETMPPPPDSQRVTWSESRPASGGPSGRRGERGRSARAGTEEFCRGHTERIEQVLLLELVQRLARGHFDDAAEDVGRMAVIPQRARLFGERHLGDPLGEF